MYERSCVPDATLAGATTLKALAHATKTAIRRMTACMIGALFWKLLLILTAVVVAVVLISRRFSPQFSSIIVPVTKAS